MRVAAALVGVAILVVVWFDVLWTTLSPSGGGGPLVAPLNQRLWRVALAVGHGRHGFLQRAGLAVALSGVAVWILLIWLGWTLVFLGDELAVLVTRTLAPASLGGRVYFVGYTLTTLGNGDFQPSGLLWQVLTVATAFNGMAVVTLSVTYFVPVVSAVIQRRQTAVHLFGLGQTPEEIVVGAWQSSWQSLEGHLDSLTPQLSLLGQRHLAYPVLHYFHDADRGASLPIAVAVLDDALTLLLSGVSEDARPDTLTLRTARSGVSALLDALRAAFISPSDQPPAPPSLEALRRVGIPTVDDHTFHAALSELTLRRRTLRGFVENDGWSWDDFAPRQRLDD